MWKKIAITILRNRLDLIIFLVLTTALMLYKTTQVQLAYDNPKFIPDDDKDNIAYQEFKQIIEKGGFVYAHWDGTNETELQIKNETKATIRCITQEPSREVGECMISGKPSERRVLFAKAY